ncbi:hypothetical protein GCM10023149_41680 [Mucilaginibacter gynuensis]|uniref:ADP-heptose:LPS heptosyltransferase n=1 Tax=Mucilaginibacter gynuensis TaxID=1302236 RepID=A0ABP8H538_9SPHI
MRKKSFLSKNWLKFTDKPAYKLYKYEFARKAKEDLLRDTYRSLQFANIKHVKEVAQLNGALSVVHSGNSGDIIYALPTIKKIHEQTGAKITLYLRLNQPLVLPAHLKHPLGNVMLNEKMAEMLFALLRQQPYLAACEIYDGQAIDIDLDGIRTPLFPTDKGNIARWCSYITGANPELWKQWLFVDPDASYADTIIVARSERYRNILIDHSFLNKYKNLVFVGVESEYHDIKKQLPHIKWVPVTNFLELARMIAGCKFFIGNQSFPFSIAEGLKIPRILESSFDVINVVPEGDNAYDFLFQEHFESLVEALNYK